MVQRRNGQAIINALVPRRLKEHASSLATRRHMTMSALVAKALREYIDRHDERA